MTLPGMTKRHTQHLDRIALEGVQFEHAFTPQPVCGPSRACPQTGEYATESGLYHQRRRMAHA